MFVKKNWALTVSFFWEFDSVWEKTFCVADSFTVTMFFQKFQNTFMLNF